MKELVLNSSQTIAVLTNGQSLLSNMLVTHRGEAPEGDTKEMDLTINRSKLRVLRGKLFRRSFQSRVLCS